MRFWATFGLVFTASWRFCTRLPLLVAITIAVEGLQHVVEWQLGMYSGDKEAFRRAGEDPVRLLFGLAKVGWIYALKYWVSRYILAGEDARAAMAWSPTAARLYATPFLVTFAFGAALVLGPLGLAALGMPPRQAQFWLLGAGVVTTPLGILLGLWAIQASTGDRAASFGRALRWAPGSILWGLALTLLAVSGPMAVHYVLSSLAIDGGAQAIALLAIDSVEVGFLGVVIHMGEALVARRMAERHGAQLRVATA